MEEGKAQMDGEEAGVVNILSVGEGHIKISFDSKDPAEAIRAKRIVKDMLRRGYALLVQVGGQGDKAQFQRALDFDETAGEYIIADLDSEVAAKADAEDTAAPAATASTTPQPRKKLYRGRQAIIRVPASGAKVISVARTAGG